MSARQAHSSGDEAVARRAIGLLDLTDLAADASAAGADELCDRAAAASVAAVCVWPQFVERCARRLAGTGVRVATVVNFPAGTDPVDGAAAVTAAAVANGADEIDVVLPYLAWLDGDVAHAGRLLAAVRDETGPRVMKVIIESGELPDPGGHRPGSPVRDRQRGRLRQDVDRQDADLGDTGGRRDHPRGDRGRRPTRRVQGVGRHPHARRRPRLPRPGDRDHGGGLGHPGDVPLRRQQPPRRPGGVGRDGPRRWT